ncbi:hypothetical protein H2200_004558 [Cladophialophora chaetospira]|uniref:Methyltransferase domain-containing protein n=1 Tax=Cladophialophora chaetospira TaxID=386627 RepID=A0AA39CKK1_9EURO|nr:hypothetical protein H2200_004558 [Cladophialophora chaetospira]
MVHRHTEKVETVDPEEFAKFNLVDTYNKAKDIYPTFTEGDEGRQRALDWAMLELKSLVQSGNDQTSSNGARVPADIYCVDIGCAHGQPVVQIFAEQGFEVTGVDISNGLLDQARRNLAYLPNAHFELADMRDWSPAPTRADGNVDCIFTFYVFGHLPLVDYEAMVAKMAGWLRPKTGILVLATVAQMHGWVTTRAATFPSTSLTIQENTALLERNGCEVVRAWEEEWSSKTMATEDSRTHQFICARRK